MNLEEKILNILTRLMKTTCFLIVSFFLFSCKNEKTGIIIHSDQISINQQGSDLKNIAPYINSRKLTYISSETTPDETLVHYSGQEGKQLDLIIKTNQSDSLTLYHFFALLNADSKWLPTDTLKLLFEGADSIQAGIYSKLYKPVYAWCKPVSFTSFNQVDTIRGIQFAYWKYADGLYASAMPLGGQGFGFTLGKEKKGFGAIGFTQFSADVKKEIPVLSIGFSKDIYKLIPGIIRQSFAAMGIPENLRKLKKKPEMFSYLGWASWNAFMQNVNEEKILASAKSFHESNIPVKWLLIDDGWLDVTGNKLNSYRPSKQKFPHEFKTLTSKLKSTYGITDVGVWHTLNGYWEGINKVGELAKILPELISYDDWIPWLPRPETGLYIVNPMNPEGAQFYDNWYSYLKDQGMTFVKVDNQLVVNKISNGNFPVWQTGEKMLGNLHQAVNKYFSGNMINCMNMTNSDFYHYAKSAVARTSEDYNPHSNPKMFECTYMGNPAAHVLACVHNSVWMSNIVWSDFDMFQSTDRDAWYFAMAKVMSAGPVYITDEPNKHNPDLLHAITLENGKVIIAEIPALPTEESFFQLFESDKPFKAFSKYGENGLLAAWNVSDRDSVRGSFSISEIKSLKPGNFVVFDFVNKSVQETNETIPFPVKLVRMKSNLYSVIPLNSGKAIIGDPGKIIPMAVISESSADENSIAATISEKCTLWIYTQSKPNKILVNSKETNQFVFDKNILSISLQEANSKIEVIFR
jgi:raffinose synthase